MSEHHGDPTIGHTDLQNEINQTIAALSYPIVIVTRELDPAHKINLDRRRLKFFTRDTSDVHGIQMAISIEHGKKARIVEILSGVLAGFHECTHKDYYNTIVGYLVNKYGSAYVVHPYKKQSDCSHFCSNADPKSYCECDCLYKNHGKGMNGIGDIPGNNPYYFTPKNIFRCADPAPMIYEGITNPNHFLAKFTASK